MLLALALVLSMMPVALADTTIDGTAKRGIKAKDVGLNEVVDGVSPTTGLDLNDMEKPDGFAGLAITGRYLPMLVQIDTYDGGVSEMAPWGATYPDIIYETPLHSSGFTRLTFLFSDLIPDSVGPVRSARVGHAVLREEWDAGFLFYGMQTYAKANVKDVFKKYGASKKGVLFSGLVSSGKAWKQYYTRRSGIAAPHDEEVPYEDRDTQEHLAFSNLIVQHTTVEWVRSDAPLTNHIGAGNADIFMGGRYIAGYWKHDSAQSRTVFYDENGDEIQLQRGKTFISIVPTDVVVSYK